MNYDEGICDERSEFASLSQSPPLFTALKSAFCKVSYMHSGSLVSPRHESFFRASPQLLIAIVQSVQLLGIALDYAADVTGYSDLYYYLWTLNLFRPEILAADYSDPLVAFYLFLMLVFIGVASYLAEIAVVFLRPDHLLPRGLMLMSMVVIGLLHRIVLFPVVLLFLEFADTSSTYWYRSLAIAGLIAISLLLLSRLFLVSDNNWYIRKFHLFAKSGYEFELKEVVTFFLISALNLGFFGNSLMINCSVMLLATGYLYYQVQVTVPYFNIITQCTKAVQYILTSWMAICILLGHLCDSAEVILLLFVFVSPLLGLFSVSAVKWRLKHWKEADFCREFWEFEVALRRMLERFTRGKVTDIRLKDVIVDGVKRFQRNKLAHLLFAQYYFYVRNEPEYALLRLACANDCSSTFVIDYQVYHFFEKVSDTTKSEERGFLDYISYYRKAMRADLFLSAETCSFLNQLLSPVRRSKKLEASFADLTKRIKRVESDYDIITRRFPHDFLMRNQYRSLRTDLFFNDLGVEVVPKVTLKAITGVVNINSIDTYTSVDTGVFVISCHHQRFGKIVFANHKCAELLDTTVEEIEGRDLDDYLPPPMGVGHNAVLQRFIRAGEAKEVFRSHLFLYALGRYSVEVTFRFRPSAFRGVPYFVVAIRGKPSTREFVLFDNNFVITSHSKSFDLVVGVPVTEKGTLNGINLLEIMPGIDKRYKEMTEKPFVYVNPYTKTGFHVMFSSTGLGRHIIRWMYLFKDESQIADLIDSAAHYIAENRFKMATCVVRSQQTALLKPRKTVQELEHHDSYFNSSSEASSSRKRTESRPENSCASFSQVNNFATSTMGLKIRERIKTAEKHYNWSFIVGVALTALLALVNLLVLFVTMEEMAAAHDASTTAFSMAPAHMAKITYFSRVLTLIELGLEDRARIGPVSEVIKEEARKLQLIATSNIGLSDYREVTVWNQYLHRPKASLEGVSTALSEFLTRVNAFISAEKFTESDDFYYIYRNGLGETFTMAMSESREEAANLDTKSIMKIIKAAVIAFLLTAGILGVSIVFIVKSIVLLSRNYDKMWELILNLKAEQLQMLTGPHLERMATMHRIRSLPKVEGSGQKGKNNMLTPSRRWPVLMSTFFLYILISTSIFILVGLYGYTQLSSFISDSLATVDTAALIVSRPLLALFFLKETSLDMMHTSGYLHLVPEGQEISHTADRVQTELATIHYEIEAILQQMRVASYEDVLISDLCGLLVNYTECKSSAASFGLHCAMREYRFSALSQLESLMEDGSMSWEIFTQLESQATSLTDALLLTFTATIDSARSRIVQFRSMMMLYFSLYCLCCVLLYVCFYRPRIVRMKRDCLTMWHVSKLVRADFIAVKKK